MKINDRQPPSTKTTSNYHLSEKDLLMWISFSSTKNLNWRQKLALLKTFDSIEDIFKLKGDELSQYLNISSSNHDRSSKHHRLFEINDKVCSHVLRFLQSHSHVKLITYYDQSYPNNLKQIADPPLIIYAAGHHELLQKRSIAIVGSRHASYYGKEIAYDFAKQLSLFGHNIVSGMAFGIDAQAHWGALSNLIDNNDSLDDIGGTIAVLGTGIDICYPKCNKKLYDSMLQKGCVISEFSPGTAPKAFHFPRRNRIISGLASATLVVEASMNSGSLITAGLALEQNRDVFAIPGPIHSVQSKGCHYLIQQGAKLVQKIDDIYDNDSRLKEHLNTKDEHKENYHAKNIRQNSKLTIVDKKVLNCIDFSATHYDVILSRTQQLANQDKSSIANNLTIEKLNVILLELELAGIIKHDGMQKYWQT